MKQHRRKTIYHRLVGLIVFIVLISSVAPHLAFSYTTKRALANDIKNQIFQNIDSVATYLDQNNLPLSDVEKLFNTDHVRLKVLDNAAALPLSDEQRRELESAGSVVFTRLPDDGGPYAAVTRCKNRYIAAQVNIEPLFQLSRQSNLLSLLLSLALGIVVSAFAGRRMLRPIRTLVEATRQVAAGDFTVQIPDECTGDEIGSLVSSFNIMTRELGSVEMLRSDFISDISHEFKTPLTAIEGYARLLKDEPDPAARAEYAEVITEEAHRLSTLAQNILTLNKIEKDGLALQKTPVCVDEQLRRALALYETKWAGKNLSLELELDEVVLPGYEQLLMQAWTNLIDNAIKFSPRGGRITLLLSRSDRHIVFSIQDEGPGIAPDDQKHIFDKFYQGDKSRGSDGNGLGLSIVRRVAEMHGGEISVRSALGEGTVFTVLL